MCHYRKRRRVFLGDQWLRLHAPNAGGPGSIPGQGTRSHMPQLKIPCAATGTQHSQINTQTNLKKKEKKCQDWTSIFESNLKKEVTEAIKTDKSMPRERRNPSKILC